MNRGDAEKTGFITSTGNYEFNVMSRGTKPLWNILTNCIEIILESMWGYSRQQITLYSVTLAITSYQSVNTPKKALTTACTVYSEQLYKSWCEQFTEKYDSVSTNLILSFSVVNM